MWDDSTMKAEGFPHRKAIYLGLGLLFAAAFLGAAFGSRQPANAADQMNVGPAAKSSQVGAAHSVRLDSGQTGDLRWTLSAFGRASNRGGNKELCIAESVRSKGGARSSAVECGRLAPPADWPVYTLTESRITNHHRTSGASVLGVLLAPTAVKATLYFGPGPARTVKTRKIDSGLLLRAGLPEFRFIALGVGRAVCLRGVTAFDGAGARVLETTRYKCNAPDVEVVEH